MRRKPPTYALGFDPREQMLRKLTKSAPVITGALCAFIALLFLGASSLFAQIPPAGSTIIGQSRADFSIGANSFSVTSPPITTTVLPWYRHSLTPPGTVGAPAYSILGSGGDTLVVDFTLFNSGNDRDSLSLATQQLPASTTSLAQAIVFRDDNADGNYNSGEEISALAFDAGESVVVSVAAVLPVATAGGQTWIELQSASLIDGTSPSQSSVFLVTNTDAVARAIFVGPAGNPQALPGGDGSPDDVSLADATAGVSEVVFANEVFNASSTVEVVQLSLADTTMLPDGVSVVFEDSVGTVLSQAPPQGNFVLGAVQASTSIRFRTRVVAAGGDLVDFLADPLDLRIRATSAIDTAVSNETINRIQPQTPINLDALLAIRHTFREPNAAVGDLVNLVVTVENISDSVVVDSVAVREYVQPHLDFVSANEFVRGRNGIRWSVGRLEPGEVRETAIKFLVNSRAPIGHTKAFASAVGNAPTGEDVQAGPAVSVLRLDLDAFSAEAFVMGDVFVDSNRNGYRDRGEVGIAGATVYTESGAYAVTDSAGAFSISQMFAGYRSVRLDQASLPDNVELIDATSATRLVHLLPSGHARVSYAVREVPQEAPPVTMTPHSLSLQEVVSARKVERLYESMTLPSSYFAPGRASLRGDASAVFSGVVAFLREHPEWAVFLEGHTDSIPIATTTFPSNVELSIARAAAVRDQLMQMGIDVERINIHGYGELLPVADNATADGRSQNRRVNISLIPPHVDPDRLLSLNASARRSWSDLDAIADSVTVAITWEFTTTSQQSLAAQLELSVPSAAARVEIRTEPKSENKSRVVVRGLRKGVPYRVSINYVVPESVLTSEPVATGVWRSQSDGRIDTTLVVTSRATGVGSQNRALKVGEWQEVATPEVVTDDPSVPTTTVAEAPPLAPVEILWPVDGAVFTRTSGINVQSRVPLGARTQLWVNGIAVPEKQLGQKTIDISSRRETLSWYGVAIAAGWNLLVLEAAGVDGSVVADTIMVALAQQPAQIFASVDRVSLAANGRDRTDVRFNVVDNRNLPVADGNVFTVTRGDSLVDAPDARPDTKGLQLLTRDGVVAVPIRSGHRSGRHTVELSGYGSKSECAVVYVSAAGPAFATGIVDFSMGTGSTRGNGDALGVEGFDDGFRADADARAFVRTTTPSGINLVARVDTRKRYSDPLLKTQEVDEGYLSFGDASESYWAAPSRGGNYVSVERGESFLRYGDFRTDLGKGEFLSYNRAITGVSSQLRSATAGVNSFVTRTSFSSQLDELPADGTSGFYYLTASPVVEGSERIVLETRDRFQPERVVHIQPMLRNRDYTINYFDGSILFKQPVAVTDGNFNPVMITANYEVDVQQDGNYLGGVRAGMQLRPGLDLAATAISRFDDDAPYALYGAEATTRFKGWRLGLEFARSDDHATGEGNASRAELAWEQGQQQHSAYLRKVDERFTNPSFRGSGHELGSVKAGFDSHVRLGGAWTLDADGYTHQFDRTDERRGTVRARLGMQGARGRLATGLRWADRREDQIDARALLFVLGATARAGRMEVGSEWEKNVADDVVEEYPDRIKSRASLPVSKKLALVANHEYLTSPTRAASHQVAAGIETRFSERTTGYSKYSLRQSGSDERIGAVTGMQHRFGLGDRNEMTAGFEQFHSLSDHNSDEYVATKFGVSRHDAGRRTLQLQYEYRWQRARSKHLVRANTVQTLGESFSFLLADALSIAPDDDREDPVNYLGRWGIAYRDLSRPYTLLGMLRNHYERFSPANPEGISWRMVASVDANVYMSEQVELRMKYAFKHSEDFNFGISADANSDLVLGQIVYRFMPAWDVDLWSRAVHQRETGSLQFGSGVELGRTFAGKIRVAAGFSRNGYEDPDVTATEAWADGFGVRVQLLLSDWVFNQFPGLAQ